MPTHPQSHIHSAHRDKVIAMSVPPYYIVGAYNKKRCCLIAVLDWRTSRCVQYIWRRSERGPSDHITANRCFVYYRLRRRHHADSSGLPQSKGVWSATFAVCHSHAISMISDIARPSSSPGLLLKIRPLNSSLTHCALRCATHFTSANGRFCLSVSRVTIHRLSMNYGEFFSSDGMWLTTAN